MVQENQELFDIIKASLWSNCIINSDISDNTRKELRDQRIEGLAINVLPEYEREKFQQASRFLKMISVQKEVIKILSQNNIDAVIIKGLAAGIYYPSPYLRMYGDIDILVHPRRYREAADALCQGNILMTETLRKNATHFSKNNISIDLHECPPGLNRVKEGTFIHEYLLSGLDDIQNTEIHQLLCNFPLLPWKQNGLELIWHIREHLYNGLGLRQIIDWMMFVNACLHTESTYTEYKDVLEQAGLLTLAKTVTRMCQLYMGLDDSIAWCKDVEETLCHDLMSYLLDQGNFGTKKKDDKAAKVLTRYRNPLSFLIRMQQKGVREWKPAREHAVLRPFAWVHTGVKGVSRYAEKGGLTKLEMDLEENRKRRELFDQLYVENNDNQNVLSVTADVDKSTRVSRNIVPHVFSGSFFSKEKAKEIYQYVRKTPLRMPLYHMHNMYFSCRYTSFGKPDISLDDIHNVEDNVTFIYKSFNRQKQAIRLYHCIKSYYPKAHVVIADDSEEPLNITDLRDGDIIIHMPFNSGLSKGLAEALDHVETPFAMRLDDDMLLTPSSNVHEQLTYLQSHPEVDLVGVQAVYRNMKKDAQRIRQTKMNRKLLIPAGTMIGGKEVVYKPPNVFVARTESMRKIGGYDPNIRMIDHHEFFYRAAGVIVCVFDEHSFVMHCHNRFEKEYSIYRADWKGDYAYIKKKHGPGYG